MPMRKVSQRPVAKMLKAGKPLAGLLVGLSLAFACGGCLVLPVPHYREHMCSCEGRVVEAASGEPAANVMVTAVRGRYREEVRTDENGCFWVEKTGGWHFLFWIATPSSGSLFPTHVAYSDDLPYVDFLVASEDAGRKFKVTSSRSHKAWLGDGKDKE